MGSGRAVHVYCLTKTSAQMEVNIYGAALSLRKKRSGH